MSGLTDRPKPETQDEEVHHEPCGESSGPRQTSGENHAHATSHVRRIGTALAPIVVLICAVIGMGVAVSRSGILQHTDAAEVNPGHLYAALKERLQPESSRVDVHAGKAGDLVRKLEKRLEKEPDFIDGWRVLGWSHFRKRKFAKAAEAYARAAELDDKSAILKSLHGEALVAASEGEITPDAAVAFRAALARDPDDVRARFFLAQLKLQTGDPAAAIENWIALFESAPLGAPWRQDLRAHIVQIARQTDVDVKGRLPPEPSGTKVAEKPRTQSWTPAISAQDIEAANAFSASEQHDMAKKMVVRLAARLENAPRDAKGWIMLIRSHVVLNEIDKARATLDKALGIFSAEAATQEAIRQAAALHSIHPSP